MPREGDVQQRLTDLEAVFAALAHASRRQILLMIWFGGGGVVSAGQIASRFHHAWPTISRHLRVLEQAGLVIHEKQGRIRLYRLNRKKLELAREWLGWFDQNQSTGAISETK